MKNIGNTPLVELKKINPFIEKGIRIFVKLEYYNPTFSIKDRIANYIIDDAEKNGFLKPNGTIVENTSGNTGAALAMIGAQRGYKVILTMPDKVSIEKQNALTAYGAELIVKPTNAPIDSPEHYVNTAKKINKETPNSFRPNQYDNLLNREAHYKSTGPEIWEQTQGKVNYFVASGSTGGTISGIGKYLKEKNSNIKAFLADPYGSIYYDYFTKGKIIEKNISSYNVEGVGGDHLALAMNFDILDEVYQFVDKDAFDMARKLSVKEGIMGGGTGGANVWAALKLASTLKSPANIVTVIPDSGIKYLSKIYNDNWMKEKRFL